MKLYRLFFFLLGLIICIETNTKAQATINSCDPDNKYNFYTDVPFDSTSLKVGPDNFFYSKVLFKKFSFLGTSLQNKKEIVEYKFDADGTLTAKNLNQCKSAKFSWEYGSRPRPGDSGGYLIHFRQGDNKRFTLRFRLNFNDYRRYSMQIYQRGSADCWNEMNPACNKLIGTSEILGFRDLEKNLSFAELRQNYIDELEKKRNEEKKKKQLAEQKKKDEEDRKRKELAELPYKNWETKSQMFGIKLLSKPDDYEILSKCKSCKDFLILNLENNEKHWKEKYDLDIKENIYKIKSPTYTEDDLRFYISTHKYKEKEITTAITLIMKKEFAMGILGCMEETNNLSNALKRKYGFFTNEPWNVIHKNINFNINLVTKCLKGNMIVPPRNKHDTFFLRLLIHKFKDETLFKLLEIPKSEIQKKGPKYSDDKI